MRAKGWEERVRELDEAAAAFQVARRAAIKIQGSGEGWLVIELQTLRRAAEALGCELVYGLAPKEGTLAAMAAAIEAGRAQRRVEARARKNEKAKEQRYEAARRRWVRKERDRVKAGWRKYWRLWETEMPDGLRRQIPKPVRETPFWRERMRKAVRQALRKQGVRLR